MPCELCPRRCRADRASGAVGFCRAGALPRVFRWGPHFGEEPPLVGEHGSGCVFFSRCTMKCLYCQNSPWSWNGEGEDIPVARLTEILRELAVKDRCSNWNLVSPTPYLPFIREAAAPLLAEGIRLPFVWNSSGYETVETLAAYRDLCDIALVDMRYASDATARAASAARGDSPTPPNSRRSSSIRSITSSARVITRIRKTSPTNGTTITVRTVKKAGS